MTLDVQFIEKRNEKENITELLASEWINNHPIETLKLFEYLDYTQTCHETRQVIAFFHLTAMLDFLNY